ncbi:MAG TPA: inner membrane CreD family protein [Planctomycetota bacterium]|nr:inner membrane CreD family protein [Planctomycetota bacterium]
MSVKRLFAVAFIFVMTAAAWFILGGTLLVRSVVEDTLAEKVEERWGSPQTQRVPSIRESGGTTGLSPESSNIKVDLKLDYRRMGLLWYSTYTVTFDGTYEVKNTGGTSTDYVVSLTPPGRSGEPGHVRLDEFILEEVGASQEDTGRTSLTLAVEPGRSKQVHLHYRSQGVGQWRYVFDDGGGHVRNTTLTITTDFKDVDFTTLSPTEVKKETDDGWELTWKYTSTHAKGLTLTMPMPTRQNPGSLAMRISFFAPVSLLFFLTVMIVICVMKQVEIHPMNYFFVAAAFFAFHLLLAYLVDHIDVHAAFFISSVVSVFLVVSYMRLFTGARFALVYAGAAQLIFLIGFSYAFFHKGFTGLAVTIGAVITLFVLMQVTGKVNWSQVFTREPMPMPPPLPRRPDDPARHPPQP